MCWHYLELNIAADKDWLSFDLKQALNNLLTGCEGNTSPMFLIQPELARAVRKAKGLYFLVRPSHPVSK